MHVPILLTKYIRQIGAVEFFPNIRSENSRSTPSKSLT